MPSGENHSAGHSNGMSSWLPNTVAQGIRLRLAGESALSQYKVALGIGTLFAVTRSPRYTTKSALNSVPGREIIQTRRKAES